MGRKTGMYAQGTLIKAMSLFLLIIICIGVNPVLVEASRRKIELKEHIEISDLIHWTISIREKIFDVYVDRLAERIIVQGEADTQGEKDSVEEYLRLKSPSNYELFSSIHIKD